jgi:hypothetical protein
MKFPTKRKGKEYKIIGFTKTSIQFEKASGGTGHTLSISTLRSCFMAIEKCLKEVLEHIILLW